MKRLFLSLTFACLGLFVSIQAQTPAGYAIFGDVPYGYTDLTSFVSAEAQGAVTFVDNVLTGAGLPGRINETGNYLRMSFTSAQTLSLTENFALHIVLQKADGAAGNVQVSLCNNGWSAARISWEIENANISEENASNVALNYSARNTDNWNSYAETNIVGINKSISGEILRICAANGELFEISQIYIDADATVPDPVEPAPGDVDAPTSLTLAASNIRDNSVTLTASATDANSPIRYTFYYKAEGDADFTAVAGSVAAASGADAVKVVTGLAPETTYSFKVVATDPSSNSADYSISGITTLAAFKHRFYFFRAGDIPEIDGVVSVDLREGTGTSFQLNNMTKTGATEYIGYTLNGSWFSFNQNLSATTDMSIASQSTWYLCIKMRTTINQNSFNLRLNNAGECWMISSGNLPLEHDGTWETLALPLSTSSKPLTFTASMTGTIFQMHANGSAASDYIDIEYAYLTDDPVAPEKPAIVDNEAPANFSVTEKSAATTFSSTTLQLYAEDEDTPITYTISYAVKNSGDTPTEVSVNGSQGSTVEKTISGLAPETTYTFSVVASDPNGNETSPVVLDITTATLTAQRYYLWRGDNSDIPSSASVTSTYVDCNLEFGNSFRNAQATDYISATTGNTWIAITLKPKTTVANEIDENWYIVVRFRANLSNNVFGFNNFRLNLSDNAQNWYINNSDNDKPFGRDYYDGQWIVIKKRIGDRCAGSAVPASYLQAGQVAVQMHVNANLIAGEFLDIDYAYFTNDISDIDEGTQSRRRIVLKDSQDNSSVLAARNGETVDVDLVRSLPSVSYNSFCVPFNMNAEQVEEAFGADAKLGKLDNARIKENDELYLGFAFVDALEAGVPYIIQPGSNVTSSLIHNVTISNSLVPTVIDDVITFHGVVNPTEISAQSAEDHTILLLGAENTLSWPNTTANIKGMRAYFQTTSAIAPVVRRARLGFEQTEVATEINDLSTDSKVTKVVRDGQLYILRDGEEYSVLGQHIHHINQ